MVFPGHNYGGISYGGISSTIGDEQRQNPQNPMTRYPSMSDFLRAMGGGRASLT